MGISAPAVRREGFLGRLGGIDQGRAVVGLVGRFGISSRSLGGSDCFLRDREQSPVLDRAALQALFSVEAQVDGLGNWRSKKLVVVIGEE